MLAKKHVKGDQEVMVTMRSMQKHLQNGSIFLLKLRIDYLKYDYCYANLGKPTELLYYRMYKALNATGRPIFYSICNWGVDDSW